MHRIVAVLLGAVTLCGVPDIPAQVSSEPLAGQTLRTPGDAAA